MDSTVPTPQNLFLPCLRGSLHLQVTRRRSVPQHVSVLAVYWTCITLLTPQHANMTEGGAASLFGQQKCENTVAWQCCGRRKCSTLPKIDFQCFKRAIIKPDHDKPRTECSPDVRVVYGWCTDGVRLLYGWCTGGVHSAIMTIEIFKITILELHKY